MSLFGLVTSYKSIIIFDNTEILVLSRPLEDCSMEREAGLLCEETDVVYCNRAISYS